MVLAETTEEEEEIATPPGSSQAILTEPGLPFTNPSTHWPVKFTPLKMDKTRQSTE